MTANGRQHLAGHLPAADPLSPRRAFERLPPMASSLVVYQPQAIWEQDTATLPKPLAKLRRRSRDFAQRELAPRSLSGDLHPHDEATDREVLQLAAEAGVLYDHLPHPVGCAEMELMDYPQQWAGSVKVEELCAACGGWGLFLSAHFLGMMPLLVSGDKKALKRFLIPATKRTAAGDPYLFAFAITEPAGGSDVEDGTGATRYRPSTVARQVEGGWSLNGRKIYISGGDIADAVMVFAALEDEGMSSWTCFLVERAMPGFARVRNELKMGQRASGATELEFVDVFVPDANVIGGPRNGWALNRATLNYSRIPVGAIALGIARGAMESAIEFVCRHRLAGKPLIDFQEVQLLVAQMVAETAALRSTIWHHAGHRVPTQADASICKVVCSDTAIRVCETAMELLGNHGVLHAHRAEKCFRDARLTQIYEGTNEINRLAIIEDLQEAFLQTVNHNSEQAHTMASRDDPFFAVPKTVVSSCEGDIELPICYYDASNYLVVFPVKADRAQQMLAGTGLKPLPVGRKALAVLTFFKYRETSIGPYHEVSLALAAVPGSDATELPSITALVDALPEAGLPLHVLDLPVSTPIADAAGREVWGYPKFVGEMPIELADDHFSGRVFDPDGALILSLEGERGHRLPEEQSSPDVLTYTLRDGQLLRTKIATRGRFTTSGGGTITLTVGDSGHRMAANLRDLGLENKSPKLLQTTDDFQALLFLGEPV